MARRIKLASGGREAVEVKDQLTLRVTLGPEQAESEVYLDRVHDFCLRVPSRCGQESQRLADFAARGDVAPPATRAVLRLAVQTTDYLDAVPGGAASLISEPVAGELVAVCVVDRPDSMKSFDRGEASGLGLTPDEAKRTCRENLRSVLPPLRGVRQPLLPGDVRLPRRRQLLRVEPAPAARDWAEPAAAMRGSLVVAAPDRGLVLYADSGEPNAVQAMALAAQRMAGQSPQPLSTTLLEWLPTGWRVYQSGPGSAIGRRA